MARPENERITIEQNTRVGPTENKDVYRQEQLVEPIGEGQAQLLLRKRADSSGHPQQ